VYKWAVQINWDWAYYPAAMLKGNVKYAKLASEDDAENVAIALGDVKERRLYRPPSDSVYEGFLIFNLAGYLLSIFYTAGIITLLACTTGL